MEYSPRYRALPTDEQRAAMDWMRNTVRQVYNHALKRFNEIPEGAGTLRQRVWTVRDELPELKDWWDDLTDVYSTVLQKAVERIHTNIQNLRKLKTKGYDVGSLNWKSPSEFRSFTYRQSGFELDRDWNAAFNVLQRGCKKLGVVHSESTPAETAAATGTLAVSARRVVETGSPCITEPPTAASGQG